MLKHVLHVANFNANLLEKMMAEIPDEKMTVQLPGLPNHPAWTVGHLSMVRFNVNKLAGNGVDFPESWMAMFGRGSKPTGDRSAYPSKAVLMETYRRLHSAACTAVAKVSAESLAGPHPIEAMQKAAPTLGDLLVLGMTSHDGLHLGQLSDWRRANGFAMVM